MKHILNTSRDPEPGALVLGQNQGVRRNVWPLNADVLEWCRVSSFLKPQWFNTEESQKLKRNKAQQYLSLFLGDIFLPQII